MNLTIASSLAQIPSGRDLEFASLNAWPALYQLLHGGWVLRLSGGFTKRANSVSVIYEERMDDRDSLAARIAFCEALFAAKRLRCVFRLTSLFGCETLDAMLAERGYALIDRTDVLCAPLDRSDGDLGGELPQAQWLDHYSRWSGSDQTVRRLHTLVLNAIQLPLRYGIQTDADGQAAACGLAVLERDLVGVFDVVTDPEKRRRGAGEGLMHSLMAWGATRGARYAHLSVIADNRAAQALYARLGFSLRYRYWYRVAVQ